MSEHSSYNVSITKYTPKVNFSLYQTVYIRSGDSLLKMSEKCGKYGGTYIENVNGGYVHIFANIDHMAVYDGVLLGVATNNGDINDVVSVISHYHGCPVYSIGAQCLYVSESYEYQYTKNIYDISKEDLNSLIEDCLGWKMLAECLRKDNSQYALGYQYGYRYSQYPNSVKFKTVTGFEPINLSNFNIAIQHGYECICRTKDKIAVLDSELKETYTIELDKMPQSSQMSISYEILSFLIYDSGILRKITYLLK